MKARFFIMFVAMFGLSQFVGSVTLKRTSKGSLIGIHVKDDIVIPIKRDIVVPIKRDIVIPIKTNVVKKPVVDSINTSNKK